MKKTLQKLFAPVLAIFENNSDEFIYRSLNRKIVLFISIVFFFVCICFAYVYAKTY